MMPTLHATAPDTGWRYLDATWFPNHAGSEAAIRRIGDRVLFVAKIGTIGYSKLLITLPTGFRGSGNINVGGQGKLPGIGTLVSHSVFLGSGLTPSSGMTWVGDRWTFHGSNIGADGSTVDLKMRAEWTATDSWPTLPYPGQPTIT